MFRLFVLWRYETMYVFGHFVGFVKLAWISQKKNNKKNPTFLKF